MKIKKIITIFKLVKEIKMLDDIVQIYDLKILLKISNKIFENT